MPTATVTPLRSTRSGHGPSEHDWSFCAELLPKVSRTFALSIATLPEDLRDPVRLAYLLCRAVDTIEDDAVVKGEAREALYDMFDELLADDSLDPAAFEERTVALKLGQGTDDHTLCAEVGAVFRCFRSLPVAQRAAIRPHVLEMSRGMREFTCRADAVGKLRLRDVAELERYCYFVAGTVGKLLTALFELHVPDLPEHLLVPIRARAVSFGLALQMVNIVKDVATDHVRGDCFLPQALAEAEGISLDELLDHDKREAGLGVIRAVCARAKKHLRRAEEYTLLWPAQAGAGVRLFCSVPLVLALATLREVEEGEDTLVPGKTPKVSRETVMRVFSDAQVAVQRNDTLSWMFGYYKTGAYLSADTLPPLSLEAEPTVASAGQRGEGDDEAPASTAYVRKREERPKRKQLSGKILVTGAAGHLGANLVERLLADGHDVRVLLREGSDNRAMDGRKVEKVYGDLRQLDAVKAAVRGVDRVFHCAAMVSTLQGSEAHKREVFDCNVLGTKNLLRACIDAGVGRVVATGSFSATGYDPDDSQKAASEQVPFYPFADHLPYGRTKVLAEHECLRALAEGLDVVMCTSTAIVGPNDYKPSRMGQTLLDYANGKLAAYIPGGFEFVEASDMVDGHIRAMALGRSGQKYTIASK